jgi:hypothetical protein
MKPLFILLFIHVALLSRATGYYVSSSTGDDTKNGTTPATAWKTLAKLNSIKSTLKAGDVILFNRGDVFTGNLMITDIKGTSAAPITFGAYGTGADPVISGFTPITTWTGAGNGLYKASLQTSCNVVTIDDQFKPMGKMPKGNSGYYIVGAGSTTSVINSIDLQGLASYVGGEIVWRPFEFTLWRGIVNSQSSSSVAFTAFPSTSGGNVQTPQTGFGFFFQNAPAACTLPGEWACNNKVLTIFFGVDNPANHKIQSATADILVNVSGGSFVKFTNLNLSGANSYILTGTNASNITIDNCTFFGGGVYGIFGNGTCNNWTITNNRISYCNSIGIRASASSSTWTVTGNVITQVGNVTGMGGSGEGEYFGMRDIPSNSIVTYNTVTNMGYVGINLRGTNTLVQYNFLDSSCTVKQDGSAIYFGGNFNSGSKVLNNVILHCFGNRSGTTSTDLRGYGIYADDGTTGVEIAYNTSALNGNAGLYIHGGYNLNVHDNTFYSNGVSSVKYYNDMNSIASISYSRNINFTGKELVLFSTGGNQETKTFFSKADSNYYNNTFKTSSATYNLSSWQGYTGKETNSRIPPAKPTIFEYNATASVKKIKLDSVYTLLDATTKWDGTIQPYSSVIAVLVGGGLQPPVDPPVVIYYNSATSKSFTKNNCTSGTGSYVLYTCPAKKYTSTISQADADNKAVQDISINGQAYANTNGTCTLPPSTIYNNVQRSQSFTRNNCGPGYTGSTVNYIVTAGKYSSTISQADADAKAINEINANGQAYANTNGVCVITTKCTYFDKVFKRKGCHL